MTAQLRRRGAPPFVVAHRGDRARAPENTMPAFESALATPAEFVETDVQLTSDGVPVLFHDDDLGRTTTGTGPVGGRTLAELETLDAGAWYAPAYRGTRVPTLDQLLARLAGSDRQGLVELKAGWTHEQVRRVVDLIEQHDMQTRVVLQSFDTATLAALHAVAPQIPRVVLEDRLPADPVALAERYAAVGIGTKASALAAAPAAVTALHAAGIAVLCYTVNKPRLWDGLLAAGIDGIITDRPADLADWLAAHRPT